MSTWRDWNSFLALLPGGNIWKTRFRFVNPDLGHESQRAVSSACGSQMRVPQMRVHADVREVLACVKGDDGLQIHIARR